MKTFTSHSTYIKSFPPKTAVRLSAIQKIVHEAVPEALEVMSYGMPAFKLNGRILIYFAGWEKHIGLYAMPASVTQFKKELSKYKTAKATIQFPSDKALPTTLIRKIVKFRAKEVLEKTKKISKKK